jgi:hypothetical protein
MEENGRFRSLDATIVIVNESYVFLRNSRVRTHCFLTSSWNSSGATGNPDACNSSPSTNRTWENLDEKCVFEYILPSLDPKRQSSSQLKESSYTFPPTPDQW